MLKAKIFTLAALLVVLMSNVQTGRADEIPMIIKWEMSGSLYAISKPGRVLSTGTALVDMTNGKVHYRVNQDSGEVLIHLNYYGDRFYVQDTESGGYFLKEYETKTLKYHGKRYLYPESPNGLAVKSGALKNSLLFYNSDTGQLVDSVYFETTMNFYYSTTGYSFDSKYYIINLSHSSGNYLFLYDMATKEMIIKGQLNTPYCFFNKSNKLALGENIKLPGDDKPYAYVRIYDPDQRKYIKDIKVGENHFHYLTIKNEDDLIFYQFADFTGKQRITNLITEEVKELELLIPPVIYADDSLFITIGGSGFIYSLDFDWGLVGVDDNKTDEDTIIYPNPTNGLVNIPINCEPMVTYKIFDTNGILLKSNVVNATTTPNLLTIDCSDLLKGVYTIQIICDKEKEDYMFVKTE